MRATTLTVMIYDVTCNRRRARLHALLKQYGVRVQWSAFEARLTPRERDRLLRRAEQLIEVSTDRLIVYAISAKAESSIVCFGRPRPRIAEEGFYLV